VRSGKTISLRYVPENAQPGRAVKKELPMSLFSVNTNLGAMAALQSLSKTANSLTDTQKQISTGQKVSSAADSPAVYAITQAMAGQIAGLSAVQDNLSFGAQVVGTASSSAASISSTLSTLKQTLTLGQTQGLNQTQMNNSISAALQQIDSFANGATLNGVNLIAGATGNGVTNTQLQVLTDTQGHSFTVGGLGAQALNATSAGLGIQNLSVTSTDTQVALGSDQSAAGKGLTLVASGTTLAGASGQAATSTNLVVQTSNYPTGGTAQNIAQQTTVVLNDGSTNGTNDILNTINAAVKAATGVTGVASYQNGSPLALTSATGISKTSFTLAAGSPALSVSSTGPTTINVPSTSATGFGQYTQYTIGKGATLTATPNSNGSTTYILADAGTGTGQVSTAQTFLGSDVKDGSATDISSLTNGFSITLASNAPAITAPSSGQTVFSLASSTSPGDTSLYTIGSNANIVASQNNNGTTTYTISDNKIGDSTVQDYKPATSAGSEFTLKSDGSIGVTDGSKNSSITNLGNGSTQYTIVTARDGNGNATSEVNIISANVSQLAVPGTSANLADALNGTSANNSSGAVATRTAALGTVVSALNGAGFNASIDASNNLTIAGNNVNTVGAAGNTTATTLVNNFTGATGTGIGGIKTTTTTTTVGTASLLLGNDAVGTTGVAPSSPATAGGLGQKLVAYGSALADAGGQGAHNTNVALTTSNFGKKAQESATNVGTTTVVMLSDGSGAGANFDNTKNATNSTFDVLNELNALGGSGIADNTTTTYTGTGANSNSATNAGTAFTVTNGQITAVTGGGGTINHLSDGSTEYSYALQKDASGNVIQQVNLVVANVANIDTSLTAGEPTDGAAAGDGTLAAALDGSGGLAYTYNNAANNTGHNPPYTVQYNSAADLSVRQKALGILTGAVTATGFNANLNSVSGALTITGTNLANATVNNFTAASASSNAAVTATIDTEASDTNSLIYGASTAVGNTYALPGTAVTLAGSATGQAAQSTNLTLATNNFGQSSLESATSVGQQTVVMLNDGTAATSLDALNALNNLVNTATNGATTGVADYANGNGSAFNLVNGTIQAKAGQTAGTVTQLFNNAGANVGTEYTYTTKTDANGNATEKVNLIVSANAGTTFTLNTDRQTALTTLANAANAAGFNASYSTTVNTSDAGFSVAGTDVTAATLNNYSNGTILGPSTGTLSALTGASVNTNVTAATTSSTSTTTGSVGVHGVQQADSSAAIANVDSAITKLGTISSSLGTASNHITGMQAFASSLSSALTAGVGALTDADMATESAKLTSLQTKQQLGIQALSIANQQPQALLKLFG
jgi:flagellin